MKGRTPSKRGKGFLNIRKKGQEISPEERVLSEETAFYVKEAYKALRTNLIFSLPGERNHIVMVSSAGSGEGKTTSCLNTAITFAETNVKVCVVDCDLRKPNIARLCKQKGSPGLSNVLGGFNTLDEVIRKSKSGNLDFVFSGDIPPNPAEIIASDRMTKVLRELAERYDYVFVDTPPLNVVTDASLLAPMVDGVLLVASQQKTGKDDLGHAISKLKFAQAKILGVLLNDVKTEGVGRGYRYHDYYAYGVTDGEGK